jgi:hypothetical protein
MSYKPNSIMQKIQEKYMEEEKALDDRILEWYVCVNRL